jgi:hypothetical protein
MFSTDMLITVLATLGAVLVLFVVVLLLLSGGNTRRLGLALRSFGRALRDPAFAGKVEPLLAPPQPAQPAKPSGEPVRLLALLQRDARLLDFFMEDIQGASDAQILAAVRSIHPQCQAALRKYLTLGPVLAQPEGDTVTVPAGFDPSAIRLTGNVTGQPPFHGTLQHPGWRVQQMNLPPIPEDQDELILMPAEVELP